MSETEKVSVADIIVLGGVVGLEDAIKKAGLDVEVPFLPGRTDASEKETDANSFRWLEPKIDGFRNFVGQDWAAEMSHAEALVDRAHLLNLTVPDMTVLVAGLRTLLASSLGQLTATPGVLDNQWFQTLLSMATEWTPDQTTSGVYVGKDRATGANKWTASQVDLIFGSDSQLRAQCEF